MSGFGISQTGLAAARAGIDVISNNLANQNTEGYKKQQLVLQQITPTKTDGYSVGQGVDVVGVTHTTDSLMMTTLNNHNSTTAYFENMQSKMSQVELLMSDNDGTGLLNDFQQFFTAANNLKNDTYSEAFKSIFVDTSETLVNNIQQMESGLEDIKSANTDVAKQQIEKVNSILSSIYEVSKEIIASGYSPTLEDKRDTLLSDLSKLTNFDYQKDTISGQFYIKIGNHRVLDDSGFRQFSFSETEQAVMLDGNNVNGDIKQGALGATIKFGLTQGNELDKTKDSLFVLVSEFVEQVNKIYSDTAQYSFTSNSFPTTPSTFASTPLLDNPDLKGLNPGDVTFKIHVDADTIKEYTYNINYTTTVDDIQNFLDTYIKNDFGGTNDILSFGASGFDSQFNINSEYPLQIIEGNTNFNKIMGLNNFFEGDSIQTLQVNPQFVNDNSSLFIVDGSLNVNINNNIATRLADLQFAQIDFQKATVFSNLNKLNPNERPNGEFCFDATTTYKSMKTETFLSFMENISFNVSKRVQTFENSYNIEKGITDTIQNKFDDATKVNQDEELMELIKYQAAYNANAKVVSALDEMMSTLLNMKN